MILMFALACTLDEKPEDTDTTTTEDTDTTPVELLCEDPVEPACLDEMILELSLHDDKVSEGEVTTETDGDDYVTLIDATAGGMNSSSDNPWTYVRFTTDGALRVDIDDETALEDMTWHMALRRYQVRINSGDGGPSCVMGAAVSRSTYDEITSVPEGAAADFEEDDFYDDECVMQADVLGGPDTLLNGWWDYASCVEMTGTPYLLQLETGDVMKLVFESYYEDDGQEDCASTGSTRQDGGWITVRWQFLE